ncbi:MAG: alpha/beta hydrolase [Promethearchaeota archaeon]
MVILVNILEKIVKITKFNEGGLAFSKLVKRCIVLYFAILISSLVWNVNYNIFGNPPLPCLILSTTTFLITIIPFEIYWSIKDLWLARWKKLDFDGVNEKKIRIYLESSKKRKRYLSATLLNIRKRKNSNDKDSIVILVHGFSDTKESLMYLAYVLAIMGYHVLIYDARGSGESKITGKKGDFISRINDFEQVVKWILKNDNLKSKKIHAIGFSIGGMTVLNGGFENKNIQKIIAISTFSNYKKTISLRNPIIILSYLLKGVKIFPKPGENNILSPSLFIRDIKKRMPIDEWKKLSSRVFLIHAKNDKIIKVKNFEENATMLEISYENRLLLKKGTHTHKKNELILAGTILKFLESKNDN